MAFPWFGAFFVALVLLPDVASEQHLGTVGSRDVAATRSSVRPGHLRKNLLSASSVAVVPDFAITLDGQPVNSHVLHVTQAVYDNGELVSEEVDGKASQSAHLHPQAQLQHDGTSGKADIQNTHEHEQHLVSQLQSQSHREHKTAGHHKALSSFGKGASSGDHPLNVDIDLNIDLHLIDCSGQHLTNREALAGAKNDSHPAFNCYDTNSDHFLSDGELDSMYADISVIVSVEVEVIFENADHNHDKKLDQDEFHSSIVQVDIEADFGAGL